MQEREEKPNREHNYIIEPSKFIVNKIALFRGKEKGKLINRAINKITGIIPKKVSIISLTDKHFV
ncbi:MULTISPECIES: hypothetical protein [Xenorhabdus]|uniref:hypothetical protein n=1 Tax=Xenorhabdus TaxID=626 RepID=UPI0006476F13|nr:MULTISPECIES: hypothetical protein [Xenorhabdus]